ncbi:peroxin 20 [Metarhizium album ARSEF 1941]|uniref:Peroxin 20 n=1 Tax=Metarhizium album (strain ARSEF 1941) TaxID=1081103 RepID=A0A0B2X042_METAS|nr:peroxin 20 [Metarhizium album ARSEF 1941]KHN99052.1 peroxin 20 [Metarhizium album ARSEF 1941]
MADASCSGPSPFKRLVDHQSRDVSHHQDRLVDRSAGQPQGSFRSARHQPPGQDSFGTFMDATPSTLAGLSRDPANRLAVHAAALQQPVAPMHPRAVSQQASASPVPDVSNWAADFSRFSGQQLQHPTTVAPSPSVQVNQQPTQMNFQSAFGQAFGGPRYAPGAASFVGYPHPVEADFGKEMSQWMSNHGAGGNMSKVDAAMEQMARELEINGASLPAQAASTTTQNIQQAESSSRYTDLETPEISSLSLQEPESDQLPAAEVEQVIHDEAAAKGKSAVSEAAERLLESVQHENGEKWQNSVFLSLMRDFRDGRKDIVDNEIRAMQDEEQPSDHQQPTT